MASATCRGEEIIVRCWPGTNAGGGAPMRRAVATASDAGISGVPTFLLGGRYALSGAYPSEQLAKAIRHVASLPKDEAQPAAE